MNSNNMHPTFVFEFNHFDLLSGKIWHQTGLPEKDELNRDISRPDISHPFQHFPEYIHSELCWDSADFKGKEYVVTLQSKDIGAVEQAIQHFKSLGKELSFLDPSTFPLPSELANRLRCMSAIIHSGAGFVVIRGLNPKKYTERDNVIAYAGIASHVGTQRSSNTKGMAMVHIRDASNDVKPKDLAADKELAPSKQKGGMKFHADRVYAPILSLYLRSLAATGGDQYIASFATIYNKLMEQDPDVLRVLAEDWQWAPSHRPDGEKAPNRMPAMLHADGRVMLQLVWTPFLKNPGLATPEQRHALEAVQRVAEESCIKLDQQEGDIVMINNLSILHTRSAFQDSATQKRHLMRLGLRDPNEAWRMPDDYAELFGKGFIAPYEHQTIPVEDFDAWDKTTTDDANHG